MMVKESFRKDYYMIRFCDCEVCCIAYDSLDRGMLLKFFFQDHMHESVCIVDKEGRYEGRITYHSLINTNSVFDAIQKDYALLDKNIWKNARYFFSHYKAGLNEHVLLPVVDKDGWLVCFAYEDFDANREIRMLRELMDNSDAVQFPDLYPEYTCSKIYEFNELAYFFAEYLKSQGIKVQVFGRLWDGFFEGNSYEELDYKCLTVYAEGTGPKKAEWIDNLLESVSVEFEYIDIIYETNIKNGIFQDAFGSCGELLDRLKNEKEIIIIGSGREAQDTYDFLMSNGIDICCFINQNYGERTHRLFGKEILSSMDARNRYSNPVFLECTEKHSVWGFGGTDDYDYMGYRRNQNFYLMRDYTDNIFGGNLINILKRKKIVLMGNIELCEYLYGFLEQKKISVLGYLDIDYQSNTKGKITDVNFDNSKKDVVGLLVVPEYSNINLKHRQAKRKEQLAVYLKERGCSDYTDYFSYTSSFIEMEDNKRKKYTKKLLSPRRIVLGSIAVNSGNTFFRGLLDNHPSILMINYGILNNWLFRYCICLSTKKSKQIMPAFWSMYEKEDKQSGQLKDPMKFHWKMEELLNLDTRFTSQELFVMFHIAFMYMNGKNISEADIKNMVIYWEPHDVQRKDVEDFARWLGNKQVRCDIVNLVRNKIMQSGHVKNILQNYKDKKYAYGIILNYPFIEKKYYLWSDRLIIKFEDLKCNPRKLLEEICTRWGIEWSDTLMLTTENGEKSIYNNGEYTVSDFDLKPVYNTNEEYFSEFDRFRIMLLNLPWQKKYGYPYIDICQFSRKELQEMFMKKFRFEDRIDFQGVRSEREFKIGLLQSFRRNLQKVRMTEIIG